MYNRWNTATFPNQGLFNNILFVNDGGKVFQMNQSDMTWYLKPNYRLQKVKTFPLYNRNYKAIGTQMLNAISDFNNNQAPVVWDTFYSKSFFSITFVENNSKYYFYNATSLDMQTIFDTYWPNDGINYANGATIDVYSVIDTDLNISHITGVNSMYGNARGRGGYYKRFNRPEIQANYGLDSGFHNMIPAWNNFGLSCILTQWGIDATLDPNSSHNEEIIWFPNARRNLYNQIKISSVVTTLEGRTVWNSSTRQFEVLSYIQPMVVGEPMLFYMMSYNMMRNLSKTIKNVMRGNTFLKQSVSAVLLYPLYSQNDGGIRRAFFMKPYGVDYIDCKLDYTMDNKKIIAEIEYPNSKQTDLVDITSLTFANAKNRLMIPIHNIKYNSGSNISSYSIPSRIRFYIEDNTNGVRSELSTSAVRVTKRRINSSVCFMIEKV